MRCPSCNALSQMRTVTTRRISDTHTRRYLQCRECGHTETTVEAPESIYDLADKLYKAAIAATKDFSSSSQT